VEASHRAGVGVDVLFESVRIGPVVAKNRFYQVPHCNGMGRAFPSAMAAMRGTKAEGGWAVVSTEQCDVHYSGNHQRELRLWDEKDIPYLAGATDQIHAHGALAAVELVHNGGQVANLESGAIPLAPSLESTRGIFPVTARAMDRSDIRALRRWHRTAAENARRAGFDIIYVYAGHDMSLPVHFLSRRHNHRTDEYGGSLENRARLLRELVEDAKDAIGDTCAVAIRFAVDELRGPGGICADAEGRELIEHLAELPDLWDVNVSNFDNDGLTARFGGEEGFQEPYVTFVKQVTTKPVVGVGRFTNPDTMVRMVVEGVLDFIGAARPSIADPFLPRKIEEGRLDDIRPCIGCNICAAWDKLGAPMRCTQNPTAGEEWRRGWHPERVAARDADERILVVGAGPAGLEAARVLGERGYDVLLAEARDRVGGRVGCESRLPGLGEWGQVRDWRVAQIDKLPNIEVRVSTPVTEQFVLDTAPARVAIATGATWRRDGCGRFHTAPIDGLGTLPAYTPDDVMAGLVPTGRAVVFDDDHYYMGGVVAERLVASGCDVVFVTPESLVSAFTQYTAEQRRIQRRLLQRCGEVLVSSAVTAADAAGVEVSCVYTGRRRRVEAQSIVLVTGMTPNDDLYWRLSMLSGTLRSAGIATIDRVGDSLSPGIIAAAVYSGHLFGRTLTTGLSDQVPFRRENVERDFDQPLPVLSDAPGRGVEIVGTAT
jgi:dimethylamine/trimethylamine dehydrogenase